MFEIEKFPCTDSKEARKRERHWIETLHSTLNCYIPSRTDAEYYNDNREEIAKNHKIYDLAHKEQKSERIKICNLANKEYLNERFDCPCGLSYSRQHKERYFKTKKHSAYLANIQSPPLAI
jgi:hypothetical protein